MEGITSNTNLSGNIVKSAEVGVERINTNSFDDNNDKKGSLHSSKTTPP